MTHHRFCYPRTVEIVDPRAIRAIDRFLGGRPRESGAEPMGRRAVVLVDRPNAERQHPTRR